MAKKMTLGAFEERAREWQTHLDTHGEQPTSRDVADKEACGLYTWMNAQRLQLKRGEFDPDRHAALDRIAPTWEEPPHGPRESAEGHGERAREFAEFLEAHGRAPSQLATDSDEKSLYRWLSNLKAANTRGQIAAETADAVERHLPGWAERKREKRDDVVRESWDERLVHLEQHLANHDGVYPGEDDVSLKHWLRQQRALQNRGELLDERAQRLGKVAPLRRDPLNRSKTKNAARVREVSAFGAEHDRLPSTDTDGAEEDLAHWLRNRVDTEDTELREELGAAAPGWTEKYAVRLNGVGHKARERVFEIEAFIAEYGRNPAAQGTTTENESRMGFWLTRARRKHRQGALEEPLRELLDERAAGWADTRSASTAEHSEGSCDPHEETQLEFEWGDLEQDLPDDDTPNKPAEWAESGTYPRTTVGEWVDAREQLDHHDWTIVATDKSHPGLAASNPFEFARRVLDFHLANH